MHLFGSGFPKSLDVSKAIDKATGAEREVVGQRPRTSARMRPGKGVSGLRQAGGFAGEYTEGDRLAVPLTAPATEDAARWEGWGTALKPGQEMWWLARKPLAGTVAVNVQEFGTGALNIGGCRVGTSRDVPASLSTRPNDGRTYGKLGGGQPGDLNPDVGRWPANILLTHSASCEMTGTREVRGNHRVNPTVQAARANVAKGAERERTRGQRGVGNPDGTETVEAWSCAPGGVAEVERFTLRDGTSVEPATAAIPVLLGALEAVRDLLPSASRSAGTQSTPESAPAHVPPGSGPAGSQAGCPAGRRSGDAPAHAVAEGGRSSARQLADALESALALGRSLRRSPLRRSGDRRSSSDDALASSTPERIAPGRTGDGGRSALSASAGTASSTAGTGSQAPLPAGLGGSTPPSSTPAHGGSAASIPSRTACTDEGFRLLASSALTEASFEGVVTCSNYTVDLPRCPVAELDRQSGALTSGANPERRGSDKLRDAFGEFAGQPECIAYRGTDSGGASRFFPVFKYEAKAPASERPRLPDGTAHPTVKPLDLMRWLVRLVTPPGGTVLDLFGGTGTTAEACVIEGFRCVLIEREQANAELAKVRLSKPIQPDLFGGAA
jgi:hypothetical protein